MLYFHNAEQVVQEQIKQSVTGNNNYAERDACIDYYTYSNTERFIRKYFKGSLLKEIPLYTQNFTQRLINRVSMVYKNAPIREVGNDAYVDFIGKKDYELKRVERLHRLLGTLAVIITPNKDEKLTYKPLINFLPFFNEGDDTPVGITYRIGSQRNSLGTDPTEIQRYIYWDKEQHFIFDADGNRYEPTPDNPDMINPFGILPVAFLQPNTAIDTFWNDGAKDVVIANRQVDIAMTMLQHHIRSAGGQFVISGRVDSNMIELGLNKAIVLEDGNMTNLNPNVDINSIAEGIKFQLMHIFQNHHVTFDYGLSGSKSGVTLKMENLELIEAREDDVEKYRAFEHDVFLVEKAIGELLGVSLTEDFKVDFAEVEFPLTPEQEQARWDWYFANGLKDKADYLMHSDPDGFPTREDAEEYLAERGASASKVKNLADTEDNAFKLNSGGAVEEEVI